MKALKDIRVLMILGLATLGFAFEGLRQFQLSRSTNVDEIGKAGELYSIHKDSTLPARADNPQAPRTRPDQIEAIAKTRGVMFDLKKAVSQYQKEHGLEKAVAKKDAKAKEKKKAEYEYVYDAKTGQWIKRKKLTEAQKRILAERRKKQQEELKQAKALSNKKEDGPKMNMAGQVMSYTPSNVNVVQQDLEDKKDDQFLSYEEWAARLLQHPNATELQRFVEAFRSQKVPADIYVRILEAMLTDPRIEMNDQGLTLASLAPSANSFKALVSFLNDQTIASSSRVQAEKHLESYSSIQNLSLLEKLMKQSVDADVVIVATNQLNNAINKYLNQSSTDPVDPSALGNKSAYISSFSKFVQVLNDLSLSPDAKVVSHARTTLLNLQTSLGRYNVAVNQMDSAF